MNTTPSTLEKEFDSKGHCTDAGRISEMNCTPEEFSWKQEVNAGISSRGVTFTGERARELRVGKKNSFCRGDQPSKSFWAEPRLGTELGNEREIFLQSMGSSGNVQSVVPKRSLPLNLQGLQQEHNLSAAWRVLEGKMARPQWVELLLGNTNTPCTARASPGLKIISRSICAARVKHSLSHSRDGSTTHTSHTGNSSLPSCPELWNAWKYSKFVF